MAKKEKKGKYRDLVRAVATSEDNFNKKKFPKSKPVDLKLGRKIEIHFYGLHVEMPVSFPGFVTEFSDSYTSNWNSQNVYGRMDPIPIYENTQRSISVGFKIVPASIGEAGYYQSQLNKLVQMLYPKYSEIDQLKLLNAAPVFRLKFGNLISAGPKAAGTAENNGIAGYITDFNVSANLEEGYMSDKLLLVPKTWNISFSYNVLHDETPGFGDDNTFYLDKSFDGAEAYPYGTSHSVEFQSAANTNTPKVTANSNATAASNQDIAAKLGGGNPTTNALAQAGVKGILKSSV
jgi:hypothetical protein